jgi:hypothetical protein
MGSGSVGRGGCWERETWTGELSGEGVVLLGPGRDQGPQRSVRGENAVVAVTVDAGRGEDLGQAVQELQGGETQGGAAGEVGPWQEVEDLVGASPDQVESVEGEGRPSKTNAPRRCPRMSRSRPARSVASIRTLASRLNPPP